MWQTKLESLIGARQLADMTSSVPRFTDSDNRIYCVDLLSEMSSLLSVPLSTLLPLVLVIVVLEIIIKRTQLINKIIILAYNIPDTIN